MAADFLVTQAKSQSISSHDIELSRIFVVSSLEGTMWADMKMKEHKLPWNGNFQKIGS